MCKKIIVVTTSRADYGLLHPVIDRLIKDKKIELKVLITGSHLSKKYGYTVKEIDKKIIKKSIKINISVNSDKPQAIAKSLSIGTKSFSKIFIKFKPNLIILCGDRFELLSVASSALINKVPIAHIGGGDRTEGTIDESIRHAVTKLSHIHFVENKEFFKRVLQMGERRKNIFLVGPTVYENINKLKLVPKKKLEKLLSFKFKKKNFLITFHPEILAKFKHQHLILGLLKALKKFKEIGKIFTSPNNDMGSNIIRKQIISYIKKDHNSCFIDSFGHKNYLSCINYVDCVIGNSSSGIVEAPFFNKSTVNIGERQQGRLRASSVIDCKNNEKNITRSIKKALSKKFLNSIKQIKNPYKINNASKKILKIIKNTNLNNLVKKSFYDWSLVLKKE